MKALLVDDERLARLELARLLKVHPEVEVVAEADSVDHAEAAIDRHGPGVIFLDISMPGASGFELLARRRVHARVVFVTAHDEFAVRAFEVHALDYLLKPVIPERLAATVARLRADRAPGPDRILVRDGRGTRVVDLSQLVMVNADGDYSELVLRDGTRTTVKVALSRWERRLGPAFARVHRSTIVSLSDVVRVERSDGSTYRLFLKGRRDEIAVSRGLAARLLASLR